MKNKISIAVLDKSEVLLSSFQNYFSNHSKICLTHTCRHSNYFQKVLSKSDVPDVLFKNVTGMNLKVIDAELALFKSIAPNMKIILVGNANSATASNALMLDINGFIDISSRIEHFEYCINMLQSGSFVIGNKNFNNIVFIEKDIAGKKETVMPIDFSSKEKMIIALLNTPNTHKEIAEGLHFQFDTYNYYLKNIYKKLGVKKRHAAISYIENNFAFEEANLL